MSGLVVDGVPDWWTEEHADRAAHMLQAALAEVGYTGDVFFRDDGKSPGIHCWDIPRPVFNKARSLVFSRFGVPFEWCPECPDDFFSAGGDHLHFTEAAS